MLYIANCCFWMLPFAALSDLETAANAGHKEKYLPSRQAPLRPPPCRSRRSRRRRHRSSSRLPAHPPTSPARPPRPAGPTRPRRSSATPRARTPAPVTGTAAGAWRRPSSRPRPVAATARWRRRRCRLGGCPTTAATAARCSTTRWGLRCSRLDRCKAAWVQWH